MEPAFWLSKLISNVELNLYSPVNRIKNSVVPTLLIHSKQDDYTPISHAIELQKANSSVKLIQTDWGASHSKSVDVKPNEYRKIIHRFIDEL